MISNETFGISEPELLNDFWTILVPLGKKGRGRGESMVYIYILNCVIMLLSETNPVLLKLRQSVL